MDHYSRLAMVSAQSTLPHVPALAPRWRRRVIGTTRVGRAFVMAALLGPAFIMQAVAQGGSDCVGALNICMAGCSAAGALGGLLGGGAAAAQRECRAMCGQQRRECEANKRVETPMPATPAQGAQRSPATPPKAAAQAEPSTIRGDPSSAGPETIVLMTVRPKDPFDARAAEALAPGQKVGIVIVTQTTTVSMDEARRLMRSEWKWRGPFPDSDPGLALLQDASVITRQKFVEAALTRYASLGGKRRNVRIDVLSAEGVVPPSAGHTQAASVARAPQTSPGTSARVDTISPLAKKYGCTACHGVNAKVLGPSLRSMAAKYNAGAAPAEALLAYKHTYANQSGDVPQTDEGRALAAWILSL